MIDSNHAIRTAGVGDSIVFNKCIKTEYITTEKEYGVYSRLIPYGERLGKKKKYSTLISSMEISIPALKNVEQVYYKQCLKRFGEICLSGERANTCRPEKTTYIMGLFRTTLFQFWGRTVLLCPSRR